VAKESKLNGIEKTIDIDDDNIFIGKTYYSYNNLKINSNNSEIKVY
jgi:hypothetical protein